LEQEMLAGLAMIVGRRFLLLDFSRKLWIYSFILL